MADPSPLGGAVALAEPYGLVRPPASPLTQQFVGDGATAAPIVAMPALGLGLTFNPITATIGLNANLADSQNEGAWRSHQAALATATRELDALEFQQAAVDAPPPEENGTANEDALMAVGLEPPEGITLEQSVVDFPPPIHGCT